MNKPGIILIGGGGHCRSVIDVIETAGEFAIAGILDMKEKKGSSVMGYPVVGTDDDIEGFRNQGLNFHITLGHVKDAQQRIRLFDKLKAVNAVMPVIRSPRAYVSRHAVVEEGTVIMHHAVVNAGVRISANCIVNNQALIEHDCSVAEHAHISTGALVNGQCVIGRGSFIGSGAVLIQGISTGINCVVGAGAIVVKNVADRQTVAGNPAQPI